MSESDDLQVIQPKIKGFICTTAHPVGCRKSVEQQLNYAGQNIVKSGRFKKALILGASSGFGLASRISLVKSNNTATVGVYLEREPIKRRTGSPGYYASQAFQEYCDQHNVYCRDFNADGFSNDTRKIVAETIKADLGKIDLLIYSLAAPRRTDPDTGEVYSSVLKPIGESYTSKSMSLVSGEITQVEIPAAAPEEISGTVKVMGGEDWVKWIEYLNDLGLLSEGFVTVAYSYIGSSLTYPIYKDGTIGTAKKDLEDKCLAIANILKPIHGHSFISVNKALITQASSAIPVVPLYLALLYRVMKDKGLHEDCIAQMVRLFNDYLFQDFSNLKLDEANRIRIDDWELKPEVQQEVMKLWQEVTNDNLKSLGDVAGVKSDYLKVFGFDYEDIDYTQAVNVAV
jgi:enoyl-[acyl-carrier protein] reductase/trans-2-enoyl-CoA reductase (NAD+)